MPKIEDGSSAGVVQAMLFRRMEEAVKQLTATPPRPDRPEGWLLPMTLGAAVPLWIARFAELSPEGRQEILRELDESDFCLRMEWVLHRGPKEGDSARAFNDLAKAIALLSFCPGGVTAFGSRWQGVEKGVGAA